MHVRAQQCNNVTENALCRFYFASVPLLSVHFEPPIILIAEARSRFRLKTAWNMIFANNP